MKVASAATKAILATGTYKKAELYQFILTNGATSYFTSSDYQITVGGHTYLTGLMIQRGSIAQSVGLNVEGFDLTLAPQFNNPAGLVTFGGFPLLKACVQGVLDNAQVKLSKIFLSSWADTSPGLVPWAQGRVDTMELGRSVAKLRITYDTEQLDVQMPRNLVMPQCSHRTYDAGCALNPVTFTVSGATSGTPGILSFNTNLTQVDGYFDLGTISFTSGVNAGISRTVRSFVHTSGVIKVLMPLPAAPGSGDTFTIIPECKKTQAACSNASTSVGPAFNNIGHFRGMNYVPQTETLYDGGTTNPAAPTQGGQGGATGGTAFSGAQSPGTYTP